MDNKRWGKRFSTIFWWSLAILPLIIVLIYFVGYHLTFNSGITSQNELALYHNNQYGSFAYIFEKVLFGDEPFSFYEMQLPYINTMYYNLFNLLEIDYTSCLASLFGWMTSVFFYHVIFDVAVWIFRFCHNLMERWCSE